MKEQLTNRHWQTIEVSANDFNSRLNQLIAAQASTGTLFSRLALIHQVAKAFALEAVSKEETAPVNIDIEEITDPPLYSYMPDDEPVVIQFSY